MNSRGKTGEEADHTEDRMAASLYEAHITVESLSVLQAMLGNRFHHIYAPCLQVAGAHQAAPSFSIPIFDKITGNWSHQYVVIRCSWAETPLCFSDYWQLVVSIEDRPNGIDVDPQGALIAPCTIRYFQAAPVSKIEIFEFRISEGSRQEKETVRFDRAIRFLQENGRAFCIACQLDGPGIATDVHISDDEHMISEFLAGSELRLCLVP
jgi:hypothetical protein